MDKGKIYAECAAAAHDFNALLQEAGFAPMEPDEIREYADELYADWGESAGREGPYEP